MYAAAIFEHPADHFLLARSPSEAGAPRTWCFPRSLVRPDESPEAAIRRWAREELGASVDILVGQPPLVIPQGATPIELRYFFCAIIAGELRPGPYAEIRVVPKSQLPEYEYDEYTRPVVDWISNS
jgi:8-oxo-dGTP pyrophosphatase MutT (NUDIX family)